MTRQTTAPLPHVSMNVTNRLAEGLANQIQRGVLILAPPYQRGSVWSTDQRIALMRSWLMGVPVPAILLNNRMGAGWAKNNPNDHYKVAYATVDGRQRLETAVAWFNGELAIPASWVPADMVTATEDTDDGPYVNNDGLTERGQRFVESRMSLPCAEAQVSTIREEAEVYLLVNGGGTPQTDTDMANAARVAAEGK